MKFTERLLDCRNHPMLGDWYVDRTCGRMLEVIYIDEEKGIVDLQDESGIFLEMSLVNWYATGFEVIEPPKNYYEELVETAIFDILESTDLHAVTTKPRPATTAAAA